MKRRLLIAAIFLLAGAVVNVAVAWYRQWQTFLPAGLVGGLDSRRPIFDLSGHSSCVDSSKLWKAVRHSGWSQTPDAVTCRRRFGATNVIVFAPEGVALEHTCGWPLRSFRVRELFVTSPPAYEVWGSLPYSGSLAPIRGPYPGLPIRPLCLGFAINTIFDAAILWLLIPGPFVLRRSVRVKRGRCVKCGYPMGESDVCSECGNALRGRAKVTT